MSEDLSGLISTLEEKLSEVKEGKKESLDECTAIAGKMKTQLDFIKYKMEYNMRVHLKNEHAKDILVLKRRLKHDLEGKLGVLQNVERVIKFLILVLVGILIGVIVTGLGVDPVEN